jgi:small subunit ribosomal protein S17
VQVAEDQNNTEENEVSEAETTPEETPAAEAPEVEEAAAEAPAVEEPVAGAAATDAPAPAGEEAPAAEPEPKRSRKRLPRALRHKHSKPKRAPSAAQGSAGRKRITRTPKPETAPGRRQERRGVVVSDKGDKTIVVKVDVTKIHPKYKKVVRRTRKFHAHDEQNAAGIGDVVRIVETRPLSKTKNWRLAEIVERAK